MCPELNMNAFEVNETHVQTHTSKPDDILLFELTILSQSRGLVSSS